MAYIYGLPTRPRGIVAAWSVICLTQKAHVYHDHRPVPIKFEMFVASRTVPKIIVAIRYVLPVLWTTPGLRR